MSKKEWQEKTLKPALERVKEREERFETTSGEALDAVYTPEDLAGIDYERDIGYPADYPYTRGVQPTMYRGRFWTMRQYAGFASAEETNRRSRYLLEQGQTGLSIAFDLPTQIGYDSDHPMAAGEVGRVGVPIDSLDDMEVLFNQIPLDKVSTSMTINSTAPILLAMYVALAKKQGADVSKIDGTIQNDVLKEYVARGTHIFPPRPSMRLIVDSIQYCSKEVSRWNTISISGYHMREAGCTAAQEVAFTLANGIAYVQACLDAGLAIDSFGPRLSFFFAAQNNLLEEVSKFRAARRLWARIMRERFGAKDSRSWMLRYHTQTAGSTLTAQQPQNNIIRTAIQALAGVLGGTQSLHTNSWDEAMALPSEESVQIALRTQQLLAYENGVADVADPLGGSYVIEYLTDKIEQQAKDYIAKIDAMGGALAAIEQGFIQREIQESAYAFQKRIEAGKQTVIGVNRFATPTPPTPGLLRVDPAGEEKQKARLANVKKNRDNAKVQATLKRLDDVARGTENTMPAILECAEAYTTLGEVAGALRGVFGEQKEILVF